jgi:hypothetical protein
MFLPFSVKILANGRNWDCFSRLFPKFRSHMKKEG